MWSNCSLTALGRGRTWPEQFLSILIAPLSGSPCAHASSDEGKSVPEKAGPDTGVIAPAPWWTQTRLLYLSIILGALVFGVLILLLYVQLKRWNMETVLHERERLARDVHDTLAQSFAGIGFQLQVIRKCCA